MSDGSGNLRWITRLAGTVGVVGAVTFIFAAVFSLSPTTVGFAYLITILLIAAKWGLLEASVGSVLATACYNFFFLPPLYTFTIADPHNWGALFAFLVTALLASQLSERARRRTAEAVSREREIERLHALSRAILLLPSRQPLAGHLAREIARIYDIEWVAIYDAASQEIHRAGGHEMADLDARLHEVATNGTLLRGEDHTVVAAFNLGGQPVGSLALGGAEISDGALKSLCNLVAIAVERARSQDAATRADAARQGEEFKSTLLDALAHEFKTPLTSIKAATSAMLGSGVTSADQQRDFTTLIDEEADRLNDLVNEALHLARIEAGRLKLNKQPVQLDAIVQNALRQFEPSLEGRALEVHAAPGLSQVMADAELIQLALHQLLDNALKYSPPRSPVRIRLQREGKSMKLSVWNQGNIPPAEQPRIFEKFYRGSNGKQQAGTGMGLAIAREILLAHGGDVRLQSDVEEGTEFTVVLPAVSVAAAPMAGAAKREVSR